MKRHSTRPQRTIGKPVEVSGVGFLTGAGVRLRFVPAPPGSGISFARIDLPGAPRVPALAEQVVDTRRRTTIGHDPDQVTLVEHVLAALAGLRIDNCLVELDAPEPPGLDGSALGFVEALVSAGLVSQGARRPVWAASEPITVASNGATLTLHPPSGPAPVLTMTYFLNYGPTSPIAQQLHTCELTPTAFVREIAAARTFLLQAEAEEFRRQGLGSRTTAADLLVFGPHGPIDNRLRHANEPARHKLLDMVGDLSLVGADLCGHLVAYRSGHPLNVEMARTLVGLLNEQAGVLRSQSSGVARPLRAKCA